MTKKPKAAPPAKPAQPTRGGSYVRLADGTLAPGDHQALPEASPSQPPSEE